MTTIAKITRAYTRYYRDTGQIQATVEWLDARGRLYATGAIYTAKRAPDATVFGAHISALFERAEREGIKIERQTW